MRVRKQCMEAVKRIDYSHGKNSLSAVSTVCSSSEGPRSTACSSNSWISSETRPSNAGGSLLLNSSWALHDELRAGSECQTDPSWTAPCGLHSPQKVPTWTTQASGAAGPDLPPMPWAEQQGEHDCRIHTDSEKGFSSAGFETPATLGGCETPSSENADSVMGSSFGVCNVPVSTHANSVSSSSFFAGCEPQAVAVPSSNSGEGDLDSSANQQASLQGLTSWDDCDKDWELQFMSLVKSQEGAMSNRAKPHLPATPLPSPPVPPPPFVARQFCQFPSSSLGFGSAKTPVQTQLRSLRQDLSESSSPRVLSLCQLPKSRIQYGQ